MRKRIIIFLIVLVILLLCVVFFSNSISGKKEQTTIPGPYLTINNAKVELSIADTLLKHIQGLSYQPSLDINSGMLFVFSDKQVRNFWMKDMNFPLDIVWISDNMIVKIDANLPTEGIQPKNLYSSRFPINYALEVNAGYCASHNIKVGDFVQYFLQK